MLRFGPDAFAIMIGTPAPSSRCLGVQSAGTTARHPGIPRTLDLRQFAAVKGRET